MMWGSPISRNTHKQITEKIAPIRSRVLTQAGTHIHAKLGEAGGTNQPWRFLPRDRRAAYAAAQEKNLCVAQLANTLSVLAVLAWAIVMMPKMRGVPQNGRQHVGTSMAASWPRGKTFLLSLLKTRHDRDDPGLRRSAILGARRWKPGWRCPCSSQGRQRAGIECHEGMSGDMSGDVVTNRRVDDPVHLQLLLQKLGLAQGPASPKVHAHENLADRFPICSNLGATVNLSAAPRQNKP